MELEKSSLAHRHSVDLMKPLVKKVSKHALDKMLEQYKKLADMDDSDECTRTVLNEVLEFLAATKSRGALKRIGDSTLTIFIVNGTCMHHLLVLPVAVRVEPFSSPRKSLMQSIKRRLYEADDDQVALLSWHVWMKQVRRHCSRFLTQSWRRSVVVQQDPQSARQSSEKSHSLSTRLDGNVRNVVRLVTILAHAMCKHLNNNKSV
ncbi:hypothetical protein BASA50_001455 [Batrachochytrium salamandrivorans]|uniref:Uncharacterized protein n=1 Tax=Batrachochytrium salamandrivorans TaxID=1357716 RepID=A0ABQ8FNX8_9FUNG|nr:hypothetical protein BASA50_001455 [Batrachochytrium salamandrivorans]